MARTVLAPLALFCCLAGTLSAQRQSPVAATPLLDRPAGIEIVAMPLEDALHVLGVGSGVPLAYSSDHLAGKMSARCPCSGATVGEALATMLAGTGLQYQEARGRVIVGPGTGSMVRAERAAGEHPRGWIGGTVFAEPSDIPIADAAVEVIGLGAVRTDVRGRFGLALAPGSYDIAAAALGYLADTLFAVRVGDDAADSLVFRLERTPIRLQPINVTAAPVATEGRVRFDSTTQISATTIRITDIVGIPGMFEADVIRAVQLLPGTIAKNDYSITYNVRGGEGDQNLVRLDGMTVFNPSHLGGLFSTFDANGVERADFFTGGFPASYPGRLSSVLDVSLQNGRPDALHGSGQVSLLSSKILLDGPLGPATFLVGARRTYADAVISALTSLSVPYYFTDAVAKLHLPLRSGGSLSLTGYWGRDALDIDVVSAVDSLDRQPVGFVFNWGNRLAGVTWVQPVSAGVLETRAGVTQFTTTFGIVPELARWDNAVRLISASSGFTFTELNGHRLEIGAGVDSYDMTYDMLAPVFEFGNGPGNFGGLIPLFNVDYHPTILSVYADDEWQVSPRLRIRPGVRVEHIPTAGFTGVAPRASFKYFLSPERALIASVGRYYQGVHSLRDQEVPVTVFEYWIGADRHVPVAHSDHTVLGYEQWFGDGFQLNLEGYRKTFRNLVIPNTAQSLRDVGNQYLPMEGESWGIDLLLRKHAGPVQGWIAYGFNWTERRARGQTFPPAHDRRHTINLVLRAPGPLGSELGLRWGLGSPLPYTGFAGEWSHRRYRLANHQFDSGETEPLSTAINAERFPTYSRLDLGLRWQFDKWGIRWNPYFQVANAYNRRNIFVYVFDYGGRPATRSGVAQVPLFPTFGIELKW